MVTMGSPWGLLEPWQNRVRSSMRLSAQHGREVGFYACESNQNQGVPTATRPCEGEGTDCAIAIGKGPGCDRIVGHFHTHPLALKGGRARCRPARKGVRNARAGPQRLVE
jgi:hypothetical protein